MNKYICAMLSHAAGDALGWPNEFKKKPDNMPERLTEFIEWSKTSGGRFYPYLNFMYKGDYSDDTQMSICTARALQYTNWVEYLAFVEFPFWLTYQRGGGSTCKKSSDILSRHKGFLWEQGIYTCNEYYVAGGNGGVMRILPHIIKEQELVPLVVSCIENNILTHGYPTAFMGAAFYACAMYYFNQLTEIEDSIASFKAIVQLYKGLDLTLNKDFGSKYINTYFKGTARYRYYEEDWYYSEEIINRAINTVLKYRDLKPDEVITKLDLKTDFRGSASLCAVGSTYLALVGKDIQDVIELGANATGADTDSLAAMAGGLRGLLCTLDDIPDYVNQLQDLQYIATLPALVGTKEEAIIPNKVDVDKLKEQIKNTPLNEPLETPIGIITPYSRGNISKSPTKKSICTMVLTAEGQRLNFVRHGHA